MQMRVLAAAAVTVSAAVHLWLWFDGYRDESEIAVREREPIKQGVQ